MAFRISSAHKLATNPLRTLVKCGAFASLQSASKVKRTRFVHMKPAYEGHIPLNWFENAFLATGSAVMSLIDPRRGDMIAALGETTAGSSLQSLRDVLLASPEGRQILKDRPRVNSSTFDMDKLAQCPEGSFGRAYVTWLDRCGVTPDTREPVHYIDDPELAYVMQRYRECHDFYHCICNLPVNVESELALKYFEFANLSLPMTAIAALFGPLRLTEQKRVRLFSEYVPWALKCGGSAKSLIAVYWERRWDQSVEEMKKEFGIWDPPEARWSKPLSEAKALAEKRAKQEIGTFIALEVSNLAAGKMGNFDFEKECISAKEGSGEMRYHYPEPSTGYLCFMRSVSAIILSGRIIQWSLTPPTWS